jgi:hypothetical protein
LKLRTVVANGNFPTTGATTSIKNTTVFTTLATSMNLTSQLDRLGLGS